MMKKLTAVMMALMMVLTLSQCKKQVENGDSNPDGPKVKVSCTIPINNGGKSDFSNVLQSGSIKWSAGTERIYLAIPNETNPQIVELTAFTTVESNILLFEGEVEAGLLTEGEYDIWYLGNSKNLNVPYITETKEGDIIKSISGSIATQSGALEDLGYCHIAKTTVTASVEDDEVVLSMNGTLSTQIAIAHLDLTDITQLKGNAIIGTEYALQYNDGSFEFVVTPDAKASINVAAGTDASYIVLLPNATENVDLKTNTSKKITFKTGVEANKIYYKKSGMEYSPLVWEVDKINGQEYVDLGLPSGLLWAKYNVGANEPEGYGNYYAWAEIETKTEYTKENSLVNTCGRSINDISGNERFDAAAANWGATWRMPKRTEYEELMTECTWDWTTQNDVNGYKVTGPNGNYIFLPAAGYINGTSSVNVGSHGYNWTSTPSPTQNKVIFCLEFSNGNKNFANTLNCHRGYSVRPVSGGNFKVPVPQYAPVTTAEISGITRTSAVCGGSVDADPYSSVTERGICWSINENPTISDNRTIDGSGNGVYTSNLTGLTTNTIYWVRAYATTAAGTSYGEQKPVRPQINNNGQDYVDLGLPSGLLWATYNVGANKPQDAGDRFAWGEVPGNDYNLDGIRIDKLYEQGYIDGGHNLTSQYDVATAKWGGAWKMPTSADYAELMDYCDWSWTTEEGIYGYKVTSKKDNTQYIFLPITEAIADSGLYFFYWTSSVTAKDDLFGHAAKAIRLTNKEHNLGDFSSISIIDYARTSRLSVRPILL